MTSCADDARRPSPRRADCYYQAGAAFERLDQAGPALEHYLAALRLEPAEGRYYPAPVELCLTYKLCDTAAALVAAGLARVPPESDLALTLRRGQSQAAQMRGDHATMTTALEQAYLFHRDQHPEIGYELGCAYATVAPVRDRETVALLWEFLHRACRGPQVPSRKEPCEVSEVLLQKIGNQHPELGKGALPSIAPVAPPAVPPPLPATPTLQDRPLRIGDAYTVWGASLFLRTPRHRAEVEARRISVTGVIGKTNLDEAPRCAFHRPGLGDPEDCRPPVPTFWLCDSLDAPANDCVQVMGWASNFAQIWGAIMQPNGPGFGPYLDEFWGNAVPEPIPQRGARLTVTGPYGVSFTGASTGVVADPIMGILTYGERTWISPPPGNPRLPGMAR
jgi:hypothetical protein